MIRLWRHWAVRAVILLPAVPFPVIAGLAVLGFFPGEPAAVIAAVAGVLVCTAGWLIAISPLDAAAVREPPAWRSAGQRARTLAALSLPIVLLSTGLILRIILGPVSGPRLIGPEYMVFGILAIIPPFLFMLHARPRGRRHWAYLGLCLPAMFAANFASPFVIYYVATVLFTGDPGAVIAIALVAFVYAALNVPFAVLLLKSGACALKGSGQV